MEAGATQTVIFIMVMLGAVMMLAAGIWAFRSRMGAKEISVEARSNASSRNTTSSASIKRFSITTGSDEKSWTKRELTGEEGPEILALLESGNKLQAIKRMREITGMELSDANDFVEKISNLGGFSFDSSDDADVLFDPSDSDDLGLAPDQVAEIASLMRSNQKIQAIKLVREWSGMGLAESKDWVEALEVGPAGRTIH